MTRKAARTGTATSNSPAAQSPEAHDIQSLSPEAILERLRLEGVKFLRLQFSDRTTPLVMR